MGKKPGRVLITSCALLACCFSTAARAGVSPKGEWIFASKERPPRGQPPGVHVYRGTLDVGRDVKLAGVLIKGECYSFYVNKRAVRGRFSGGFTGGAYPVLGTQVGKWLLVDITDRLRPGVNEIMLRGSPAGLILEGRVTYESGRESTFLSDAGWEFSRLPSDTIIERGPYFKPEAEPVWQKVQVDTDPKAKEPDLPAEAFGGALARLHFRFYRNHHHRLGWAKRHVEMLQSGLIVAGGRVAKAGNHFHDGRLAAHLAGVKRLAERVEKLQLMLESAVEVGLDYATLRSVAKGLERELSDLEGAVELHETLLFLRDEAINLGNAAGMLKAEGIAVGGAEAQLKAIGDGYQELITRVSPDDVSGGSEEARSLKAKALRLRSSLGKAWGHKLSNLDESEFNKCGWVRSGRLMDTGLERWNIRIGDPERQGDAIPLSGVWLFRTDPKNEGLEKGWHREQCRDERSWGEIYCPSFWETEGINDENLFTDYQTALGGGHQRDEPYNGFAWYRKHVYIPAGWRRCSELRLRVGDGGVDDMDWVYFNGKEVGSTGPSRSDYFWMVPRDYRIPRRFVRFGEVNTISWRVFDVHGDGGIAGSPALEAVGLRSPRPPTVSVVTSHLTPGVLVRTQPPAGERSGAGGFKLWGWEMVGSLTPGQLVYTLPDRVVVRSCSTFGEYYNRKRHGRWAENWLLLARRSSGAEGRRSDRPVLLVFQNCPEMIEIKRPKQPPAKGQRPMFPLEFTFKADPGRVAVMALDEALAGRLETDKVPDELLKKCRFWSRALLAYPANFTELVRATPEMREVIARYSYVVTEDEWGTEPVRVAPLPMLFSFASESGYPGIGTFSDVVSLDHGTRLWGAYLAALDTDTVRYWIPPEPKWRTEGVGVCSRGGLRAQVSCGTEADFLRMKGFGFNSNRVSPSPICFILEKEDLETVPASERFEVDGHHYRKEGFRILDRLVDICKRHDMNLMITLYNARWPIHAVSQLKRTDPKRCDYVFTKLVHLWKTIAARYAGAPEHVVTYDFINEPGGSEPPEYNRLVRGITAAIRSVDKVHPIIIETAYSCSHMEMYPFLEPTGDGNTWYSCHYYNNILCWMKPVRDPTWVEDDWLPSTRFMLQHNVPLHMGEISVMVNGGLCTYPVIGTIEPEEEVLAMKTFLHLLYKYDWHYSYYSYVQNQGVLARHPRDRGLVEREFLEAFREYLGRPLLQTAP